MRFAWLMQAEYEPEVGTVSGHMLSHIFAGTPFMICPDMDNLFKCYSQSEPEKYIPGKGRGGISSALPCPWKLKYRYENEFHDDRQLYKGRP